MTDYTGACLFFDQKPFIDAANILVASDEPLRALDLLSNLPAFYRDHMPKEIHELRARIYRDLATPIFYQKELPSPNYTNPETVGELFAATVDGVLRGQMILKDVLEFNDTADYAPNIIDLGPGEYWLPIGMKHKGARFRYTGIGLCDANESASRPYLSGVLPSQDKADIFVACELIEHLHHEQDIRVEFERYAPDAKIIHLSTPKYTFDGRAEQLDWQQKKGLGHLRTYTPREFHEVVARMFPEFEIKLINSRIMHIRGVRVAP